MNDLPVPGDVPIPEGEPARQPQPPPREPFWDWQDAFAFLFLLLPAMLTAAAITEGLRLVLPGWLPTKASQQIAAQFIAYGLWFLGLWALLQFRYGKPFWRSLGWRLPHGVVMWSVFGVLLAFGAMALAAALHTPDIRMPFKELMSDRSSVALIGGFAVTLGPLCEELAFRGFLFPLVARSLGPLGGAFVSALPFALLHGPQYAWSWRHVLIVALAGTAFGWARYRSGSTVAATLMHAAYNGTFFALFLLVEKEALH